MFCDGELSLNVSAIIVHLFCPEVNIVPKRAILLNISRQGTIFPLTTTILEACQVHVWRVIEDLAKVNR
jgi:hypothetical protein